MHRSKNSTSTSLNFPRLSNICFQKLAKSRLESNSSLLCNFCEGHKVTAVREGVIAWSKVQGLRTTQSGSKLEGTEAVTENTFMALALLLEMSLDRLLGCS